MKAAYSALLVLGLLTGCSTARKGSETSTASRPPASLQGSWELDLLSHPTRSFDALYPDRKPELSFDTGKGQFSGFTSCNRIHGALQADASTISFKGDIAMTRMACPGEGEAAFMEQLKRINRYSVSADGKQLTFIQGDIALMRFHRK